MILDVGCGTRSPLAELRSERSVLIGLDISRPVIEAAASKSEFDGFVVADFMARPGDEIRADAAVSHFDVVAMLCFIEHLPKAEGFAALDRCEELTSRYVVVMTPFGFVPQGPEYGNEFQRHRSGWFPEDFEGRGYRVEGALGCRALHSYGGLPRWQISRFAYLDAVLFRLLGARRRPSQAVQMIAIKDVTGVPPRHISATRPG